MWQRLATRTGGTVAGLALAGETLLAATPVGVFRRAPQQSWIGAEASAQAPFATSIAAAPGGDGRLFVGGRDGVYRSDDGGRRWRHVLAAAPVLAVAAGPDGLVLAASALDGVLRSENGGDDWASAHAGLLDLAALALALSPSFASDRTAWLGTASGLYRSINGGRSWRAVELGPEEPAVQAIACSPRQGDDRWVLAGTEAHGLFRSADGGRSWHAIPLPAASVSALAVAASGGPWHVAAATEAGVLLGGHDGGWRASAALPAPVLALAAEPAGSLVAGLAGLGVAQLDAAGGWRLANEGLEALVTTALAASPAFADDRRLFALGADGLLGVSADGGATFDERLIDPGEPGHALALSPGFAHDGTLWLATGGGLWRSRDRGRSFELLPPPAEAAPQALLALAGEDGAGTRLLTGDAAGRLQLSRDGGERFATVGGLPEGHAVMRLVGAAGRPGRAALLAVGAGPDAAGQPGTATVWLSRDAGRSWRELLAAPCRTTPPALLLDHADGRQSAWIGVGARLVIEDLDHAERRSAHAIGSGAATITALAGADTGLVVIGTDAGARLSLDGGANFIRPWDEADPGAVAALAVPTGFARHGLVLAAGIGGALWRWQHRPARSVG